MSIKQGIASLEFFFKQQPNLRTHSMKNINLDCDLNENIETATLVDDRKALENFISFDYFFNGYELSPQLSSLLGDFTTEANKTLVQEHSFPITKELSELNVNDLIGHDAHDAVDKNNDSGQQKPNVGLDQNGWIVTKYDPSIIKEGCGTKVLLSSRKFSSSEKISSSLYSCVTYEMRHEAFGSFVEEATEKNRILLVKVEVVDPSTGCVVLKKNQPILDGSNEGAITKMNHCNIWRHDMKIKFNSCSYHFNRTKFKFRISYFFDKLEDPFYIKESSEFMIYARVNKQEKNSKKKSSHVQNRKRKQEALSKDPASEDWAKQKKARNSESLERFSNNLNSLLKELNSLESNERQIAFEMIQTSLRNLNS
jgi:hypothetical protein